MPALGIYRVTVDFTKKIHENDTMNTQTRNNNSFNTQSVLVVGFEHTILGAVECGAEW